jgi:hypothetical protein
MESMRKWMSETTQQVLTDFIKIKTSLDFTNAKHPKKKESYQIIMDFAVEVIADIIERMLQGFDRSDFILFLAYSCFSDCFIPNDFATEYEFQRLEFGKFGNIKSVI